MSTGTRLSPAARNLIVGASIVIVLAGMMAASDFITPIILALVITLLCTPILRWLQRTGMPPMVAVFIVVLIVIVVIMALVVFAGMSLSQLSAKLPGYQARLVEIKAQLGSSLEVAGIDATDFMSRDSVQPEGMIKVAGTILGGLIDALGNSLMLLALIIFMLIESAIFPAKLRAALGSRVGVTEEMNGSSRGMRDYVWTRAVIGIAIGATNAIFLIILGVDFPILWGMWSVLTRVVPNIGWILAVIPPLLLALIQYGWITALIVLVGYFLINSLVDSVISMRYMKNPWRLSPVVAFISFLFWGWILGPVGALLAIPLRNIVMVLLRHQENTRWMAIMLSSGATIDATSAGGSTRESTT